jgi:hypothetical protein
MTAASCPLTYYIECYRSDGTQILGTLDGQGMLKCRDYRRTAKYKMLLGIVGNEKWMNRKVHCAKIVLGGVVREQIWYDQQAEQASGKRLRIEEFDHAGKLKHSRHNAGIGMSNDTQFILHKQQFIISFIEATAVDRKLCRCYLIVGRKRVNTEGVTVRWVRLFGLPKVTSFGEPANTIAEITRETATILNDRMDNGWMKTIDSDNHIAFYLTQRIFPVKEGEQPVSRVTCVPLH